MKVNQNYQRSDIVPKTNPMPAPSADPETVYRQKMLKMADEVVDAIKTMRKLLTWYTIINLIIFILSALRSCMP